MLKHLADLGARSTAVRVLALLSAPFETRLEVATTAAPTLVSVVQQDADAATSMARAEALTGLSRLAQHGLRCKRLEAELERMDVFAQLRACVQ